MPSVIAQSSLPHGGLAKFGLGATTDKEQGASVGGTIAIASIAFDSWDVPLTQVYSTNPDSIVA